MLRRVFWAILRPESAKKHSSEHPLGHSGPGVQNHSKSTLWGTFRPWPWALLYMGAGIANLSYWDSLPSVSFQDVSLSGLSPSFLVLFCHTFRTKSSGPFYLKNPRVRKISCPQFWGRKWLRQFYGYVEKLRSFCKKTHVHKIPRFRGGGGILGFGGGGGKCRFYFYGRKDFADFSPCFSIFPPLLLEILCRFSPGSTQF